MEIGIVPVIPLGFAFFLPLLGHSVKSRKIIELYALTASLLTAYASWELLLMVYSSEEPLVYFTGNWPAPVGITLEVDRLSSLIIFTASVLFVLAIVYSIGYMERENGVHYYYTALLGLESGIVGALMTGDAFNIFVMFEVIGASSYFLVGFIRRDEKAVEAAFKYGIVGAIATSLYFLAMGFLYSSFGTLNLADLSARFHGTPFPVTVKPFGDPKLALAVFFALTISMVVVKSANFPGHFWLPDAHPAAPSPVSALLSGLVVAVPIYVLARYLYTVFPPEGEIKGLISAILLVLGASSAFLGSTMMLVQRDIKRLVAYSTIMHTGYMFMGLGVLSFTGLMAVTYHIVNHALAKALLFLAAGSFIHASGTKDFEKMAGIGRSMPFTTFAFVVATLSLVGVPPLNAFFSKMLIYDALVERSLALGAVVITTSAVAAWAYFKALLYLWRGKPSEGHHNGHEHHHEEPHGHENPYMAAVMVAMALTVIVVGILSPILIDKLAIPAAAQAMDYQSYIDAVRKLAEPVLSRT
ncbi:proton-conducting transporter transmembrane domain-containing protein [Thermococcus waiotapuensis]|uniref:Proton-conducting transporter membrane subunit n=1 Tax=Thermococcus waiotapuensis TaxID=90909 RepID=A0AAE4NT61_9EURY|nr:proton-conducting transporter membrane subunit [Thermococcus waiotapuensis]MDV3103873.1 proton-conducting transporter membrane subunit [Thermococcus waiotapuensis]